MQIDNENHKSIYIQECALSLTMMPLLRLLLLLRLFLPLAESEGGRQKQGFFSLDTLVTVVDSTSFLDEVRKADDLEERGLEAEEGDTRTIADLLVSQAGVPLR